MGSQQSDWLIAWRACDNAPLCQRIALQGAHPPQHFMKDIGSRVPAEVMRKLAHMRPSPSAPLKERVAAFAKMCNYLDTLKHDIFSRHTLAPCMRHPGQACPIAWRDDETVPTSRRALTMNISGPVCLPWTSFGRSEGLGHMATEAFLIWSREVEMQAFDFCLMENSPRFPPALFADRMRAHSHVITATIGPELLGWPVRRQRMFSIAVRRESLVWVGPPTDSAVLSDFLRLFNRRAVVDANVFAGADSSGNVLAERVARADNLKGEDSRADLHNLESEMDRYFGSQKGKDRINGYMRMVDSRAGKLSNTMVADCSQTPKLRCRAGAWMMTVTRSSDLVLLRSGTRQGHFFTPSEVGLSQGWPLCDLDSTRRYRSCLPIPFDTLSRLQQRKLQGNGMHLTALMTFVGYIMSHCLRRDVALEFLPPLQTLWQNTERERGCKRRRPDSDHEAIEDNDGDGEF